jgi:hypothetical protein
VHVQADGYHTWVKELPVSKHLVTEAQAFNLPLVANIRVIAPWQTATGTMVVRTPLLIASTTNAVLATTTKNTSALIQNTEYLSLYTYFATASPTSTVGRTPTTRTRIDSALERTDTASTSTEDVATTTKESGGVRLYESDGDIYARWIGSFGSMPYYYCAEEFPRYSTSTEDEPNPNLELPPVPIPEAIDNPEQPLMHPVQTVPENVVCDPAIRIDRKWQEYTNFDFFPGSSDLVVVALSEGVYVVEIDDRGWQNMQPLIMGENVRIHIENGTIYVYDGILIYQIVLDIS